MTAIHYLEEFRHVAWIILDHIFYMFAGSQMCFEKVCDRSRNEDYLEQLSESRLLRGAIVH